MQNNQRAIAPLLLIIFLDSFAYFLVIPVLMRLLLEPSAHFMAASSQESTLWFSATLAISPLAGILAAPLFGRLSDHFGRKSIMSICLLLSLIGFALPLWGLQLKSIAIILAGRMLSGIASNSQPIAQAAFTDISEGKARALNFSWITIVMVLAMVFGPLVGSYLSDTRLNYLFSLATPFYLGGLLAVFNLGLLLVFCPETHGQKRQASNHWQLSRQPKLSALLIMVFCTQFAWSLYYQAIPLYTTHHWHYHTERASLLLGYLGLWMAGGLVVIFPWLLQKISIKQCLSSNLLIAIVTLLGICIYPQAQWHWLFAIPMSISFGMVYPCILNILSNQSDNHQQGSVMGIAGAMLGIAWFASGAVVGVLFNHNALLPFWTALLALGIAAVLWLAFRAPQKVTLAVGNSS